MEQLLDGNGNEHLAQVFFCLEMLNYIVVRPYQNRLAVG